MRYREAKSGVKSLLEQGIGSEEVLRGALTTMVCLCDEAMRDRGDLEADLVHARNAIKALEAANSVLKKKQAPTQSEEAHLLHAQGEDLGPECFDGWTARLDVFVLCEDARLLHSLGICFFTTGTKQQAVHPHS
jgi:hypothetical protein